MSRREKILLAAVCVTAVIGLWITLDRPAPPPPQKPRPSTAGEAEKLLRVIKDSSLRPSETALLEAIRGTWRRAALYDKSLSGPEKTQPKTLPRFTGYVELGSGRLAVVDGMEYQVGDTLDGGGYKVLSIAPEQVVLESLANGQQVPLPYEGEETKDR